jgi:hypothetical protein
MKYLAKIVVSLVVLASLAGCSGNASLPAQVFGAGALGESELRAVLVSTLRDECTSLNEYVLTPSNWTLVESSDTSSLFSLYGDGGTLSLNVIPDGVGGANVVIADIDSYTTNINLFNSGCRSIASDITGGYEEQTSPSTSGYNEERCTQVQVPNPQWDPYAAPGVMSMRGIPQFIYEQQCQLVWVPN